MRKLIMVNTGYTEFLLDAETYEIIAEEKENLNAETVLLGLGYDVEFCDAEKFIRNLNKEGNENDNFKK